MECSSEQRELHLENKKCVPATLHILLATKVLRPHAFSIKKKTEKAVPLKSSENQDCAKSPLLLLMRLIPLRRVVVSLLLLHSSSSLMNSDLRHQTPRRQQRKVVMFV